MLALFFGLVYSGIALALTGTAVVAYALLRDPNGTTTVATAFVVLLMGSLWVMATHSSGPDGPPSLDAAADAVEVYRAALAVADLATYPSITELVWSRTVEEAFAAELDCRDWDAAGIEIAAHGISSSFAFATFSDDHPSLIRLLEYQARSDQWIVTVGGDC